MMVSTREYSWPVVFSVLLHGAIAVALLLITRISITPPRHIIQPLPIDAVVISSQVLHAAQQAQEAQAAARAADAARAAAAVEAQKAADQQRAAEQQAAAAQKAADAQQAEEAEKAAAAQRVAEAQKAVEAQKAAEAQRAAEAQKAAEAQRAADAKHAAEQRARADREAELKRQLAEEEHVAAVEASPKRDQYVASLQNAIQHAWIRPPSARVGVDCLVEVTQVPGGAVTGARVTQCNGDAAVRQSIENAVYRASPLPDPPDPALFQRNFAFRFKPND
jgi:colicin import membrane protein